MPLYEYQCEACHHRFEVIQKYSDPRIEACPRCAGRVQKLLSSPAIQFRGSGWYITDYARKDSNGRAPGTDAGESSKPAEAGGKAAVAESKSESSSKDSSTKAEKSPDGSSKAASTPSSSSTST